MPSNFFLFALLFTASYSLAEAGDPPQWFLDAYGGGEISEEYSWELCETVSLQSGTYIPVICGEAIIATFDGSVVVVPNPIYCTPSCSSADSCNSIVATLNGQRPNVALEVAVTPTTAQEALPTDNRTPVTFYVTNQFYTLIKPNTRTTFYSMFPPPEK